MTFDPRRNQRYRPRVAFLKRGKKKGVTLRKELGETDSTMIRRKSRRRNRRKDFDEKEEKRGKDGDRKETRYGTEGRGGCENPPA